LKQHPSAAQAKVGSQILIRYHCKFTQYCRLCHSHCLHGSMCM